MAGQIHTIPKCIYIKQVFVVDVNEIDISKNIFLTYSGLVLQGEGPDRQPG